MMEFGITERRMAIDGSDTSKLWSNLDQYPVEHHGLHNPKSKQAVLC
jgi:hypothetical protein